MANVTKTKNKQMNEASAPANIVVNNDVKIGDCGGAFKGSKTPNARPSERDEATGAGSIVYNR